jgi:uncharacterized membrane protein YgdD (TMEM256/DUF423 family)
MRLVTLAALLGFFGVALGAFGAHGLRGRIPAEGLEIWKTAVLYHLVHAAVLAALGLAGERLRGAAVAAGLFVAGILVFSGTLYALALSGRPFWGAITPVGGLALLAGWLTLAIAGILGRR